MSVRRAKATNWVAVRLMREAAKTDQMKMGSRNQLRPGARRPMMVARKLRPPRIDENQKVKNASRKKSSPRGLRAARGG